jgi:hypothetical protein
MEIEIAIEIRLFISISGPLWNFIINEGLSK